MLNHLSGGGIQDTLPVHRAVSQRVLDIIASGAGLVLLSPFLLIIAVSVKVQDRGPVFYRSRRVGIGGRLFSIYKFRTMVQVHQRAD